MERLYAVIFLGFFCMAYVGVVHFAAKLFPRPHLTLKQSALVALLGEIGGCMYVLMAAMLFFSEMKSATQIAIYMGGFLLCTFISTIMAGHFVTRRKAA